MSAWFGLLAAIYLAGFAVTVLQFREIGFAGGLMLIAALVLAALAIGAYQDEHHRSDSEEKQ